MSTEAANDQNEPYLVLRNHEEQCSLWLASIEIPAGWHMVFGPDQKDACAAWVDENWTDMRPLSLRNRMQGQ